MQTFFQSLVCGLHRHFFPFFLPLLCTWLQFIVSDTVTFAYFKKLIELFSITGCTIFFGRNYYFVEAETFCGNNDLKTFSRRCLSVRNTDVELKICSPRTSWQPGAEDECCFLLGTYAVQRPLWNPYIKGYVAVSTPSAIPICYVKLF